VTSTQIETITRVRWLLSHWILGVILTYSLVGCGTLRLQQPTVKAGAVKLTALDFQKADLAVELQVMNPNATTLVIAGYSYDLQIETQRFLSGASETEFELKPKDVSLIGIPIAVKFFDLTEKLNALKGKPDAGYVLAVSLGVRTPIGTYPLSFHKEGRIPVLTVPRIRLRSVRLGQISAEGPSLEALVEVSDPGASVKFSAFTYALSMNGMQVAAGADEHPQPSPSGDSHLVRIPVHLDSSKTGSLLRAILLGSDQPTFTLTGQATFSSPLGPLTFPFSHTQRIKLGR